MSGPAGRIAAMSSMSDWVRDEPGATRGASLGLALALILTAAVSAAPMEKEASGRFSPSLAGCHARGGHAVRGPFGERFCRIRFPDAGRACTDGSQCLGNCYWGDDMYAHPPAHVVGACQTENVKFGCYFTVVKGRATNPTCAD